MDNVVRFQTCIVKVARELRPHGSCGVRDDAQVAQYRYAMAHIYLHHLSSAGQGRHVWFRFTFKRIHAASFVGCRNTWTNHFQRINRRQPHQLHAKGLTLDLSPTSHFGVSFKLLWASMNVSAFPASASIFQSI